MTQLTSREKKLIYATFILCIVVIGCCFIIVPKISSIKDKQTYLDQLVMDSEAYQLDMSLASSLNDAYKNNLLALDSLDTAISNYVQDEELERVYDSLVNEKGMKIQAFSLSTDMNFDSDELVKKDILIVLEGAKNNCIELVDSIHSKKDTVITTLAMESNKHSITLSMYMKVE